MATTLVLGAARNGESDYAATLMAAQPEVNYVATGPMHQDAPDDAWAYRVAESSAQRPDTWKTQVTSSSAGR